MTESKPLDDVHQAEAELPKHDFPAEQCDAFDPKTCPWCDHYEECGAQEQEAK